MSFSVPPEGEIVRPKPKAGQKLYVMKIHTFSEWVQGVIEDVITKTAEVKGLDLPILTLLG